MEGQRSSEGLWRSSGADGRDPRLSWFAAGGKMDGARPSARVLGLLECLARPSGPRDAAFAGATWDETAGMLAAAAAVESHATAMKLALVRQVIRRHAPEAPDGSFPDSRSWDIGVLHEVAAILRISVQSADPVVDLAWRLEVRLPGVGELLDIGVLTWLTAKIITDEFWVLDDDPGKLAEAEKLLLDHDLAADDMTPAKIRRLCQRITDTVDPDGVRERRERKERDEARVRYFRGHGGAGSLFASGLPPDEALKSEANVQKRALEYKGAGIREKMDFLRVLGLVDLTNGVSVPARLALWRAEQDEKRRTGAADPGRDAWEHEQREDEARRRYGDHPPFPDTEPDDIDDRYPDDPDPGDGRHGDDPDAGLPPFPEDQPPFPDEEPDDIDDRDEAASRDDADSGCGSDGRDRGSGSGREDDDSGDSPAEGDAGTREDRGSEDGGQDDAGNDPGDGDGPRGGGSRPRDGGGGNGGVPQPSGGTGPVPAGMPDPGLPTLANMTYPLATVLGEADRPGEAAGYGSLDPALVRRLAAAAAASPRSRFCLTFTDEQGRAVGHGCARLIRGKGAGPPPGTGRDRAGWGFTRDATRPGPRGGYGSWILTVPGNGQPGSGQSGGRQYRIDMHKIPLRECDHRYATDAYQPGDLLRHLVQVRDGECSFTGCSHNATQCDFEHTVPWHEGGATDGCNGAMRSRRCHKVKQSRGWRVTQPEPGRHQWQAPSGRTYEKGAKRYPD